MAGCPQAWIASELAHLDRVSGDVETLADRIAGARTWTYVAHRPDWLADAPMWAERTRARGGPAVGCAARAR